jgi:hypothetical protein
MKQIDFDKYTNGSCTDDFKSDAMYTVTPNEFTTISLRFILDKADETVIFQGNFDNPIVSSEFQLGIGVESEFFEDSIKTDDDIDVIHYDEGLLLFLHAIKTVMEKTYSSVEKELDKNDSEFEMRLN